MSKKAIKELKAYRDSLNLMNPDREKISHAIHKLELSKIVSDRKLALALIFSLAAVAALILK